ncbi:hypothetical protein CANCADRAFT_3858 [Tortispora caseinolytica NRRL Y-17796]|uniref:Mitochondrial carrier protein RIM2 n=1 Tax=Tortispora caseinolytica NRRL Y-17796 TaxID=767744 RepID=A0A1E4TBT8_9ASCO|nr:hypothetical protein CANCADRAFT_3858 [Tortispora caseinolytica NRRL Y-17796]
MAAMKPVADQKSVEKTNRTWLHFVAGGIGGMAGAVVTAPFDVVKTRLQSDMYIDRHRAATTYRGLARPFVQAGSHVVDTCRIIAEVYTIEGPKALFKGLGPNLVGVIPARAINFYCYSNGKAVFEKRFGISSDSSYNHLLSAATAGVATSTATNPIWLIKTRLQLDKEHAESAHAKRQYKNSLDCTLQVMRNEGIKGLYRGLTASYLGVVESTLQWILYERMKTFVSQKEQSRQARGLEITTTDKFLGWAAKSGAAGLAKVVASILTYPHEVLRTRLRQKPLIQGQPKYTGLIQCFKLVWLEEGFVGLYGGLTPHLMRTVPNSIIMFGTWDLIMKTFG